MRYRLLLVPVLLTGLAAPVPAGIIFGKKPKMPPEKRVPELLVVLKTDGDESKRVEAAEETGHFGLAFLAQAGGQGDDGVVDVDFDKVAAGGGRELSEVNEAR